MIVKAKKLKNQSTPSTCDVKTHEKVTICLTSAIIKVQKKQKWMSAQQLYRLQVYRLCLPPEWQGFALVTIK